MVVRSVVAADFNADHVLDLVVGGDGDEADGFPLAAVLLGNGAGGRGDGTFAAALWTEPVVGLASLRANAVAAGDLDADGILDLALAQEDLGQGDGKLRIFHGGGAGGRGDGAFASGAGDEYFTGHGPQAIVLGDFNADHVLDVAVANRGPGTVSVFLGNGAGGRGDGTFGARVNYSAGGEPSGMLAADFDRDGILDLAVADTLTDDVAILRGNGTGGRGTGTFAAPAFFPAGDGPAALLALDANGDGMLDLVTANGGSGDVSLLAGLGAILP
jgi:hypothetical protein